MVSYEVVKVLQTCFRDIFGNVLEQNDNWQNEKDKRHSVVKCLHGLIWDSSWKEASFAWKELLLACAKWRGKSQLLQLGIVAAWNTPSLWTMVIRCVKCWLVVPQRYRNSAPLHKQHNGWKTHNARFLTILRPQSRKRSLCSLEVDAEAFHRMLLTSFC